MPGKGVSFQLLRFTVPGLPDVDLALPLPQVLEVGDLPPVTQLPFTPLFVQGVSMWRSQLITIIDLAALLCSQETSYAPTPGSQHRCIVAQLVIEQHIELVAWPILPGTKTVAVPPHLEQASPLDDITSWLVFSTVAIDGPLTVLDLDHIVRGFSNDAQML